MAAQYDSIKHFQRYCAANTVSTAITLPTTPDPSTKVLICPSVKDRSVFFLIRAVGSSTEPSTVAHNANGEGSPAAPPGIPIEINHLPTGAYELVLKTTQAADVTVLIYNPSSV
jgi:hypothetical protein